MYLCAFKGVSRPNQYGIHVDESIQWLAALNMASTCIDLSLKIMPGQSKLTFFKFNKLWNVMFFNYQCNRFVIYLFVIEFTYCLSSGTLCLLLSFIHFNLGCDWLVRSRLKTVWPMERSRRRLRRRRHWQRRRRKEEPSSLVGSKEFWLVSPPSVILNWFILFQISYLILHFTASGYDELN